MAIRHFSATAASLLVITSLHACSIQPTGQTTSGPASSPASPAPTPVSPTMSETFTGTPEDTSAPVTSGPGSETTGATPSDGPTIVRPTASSGEQRITLAEAARSTNWREGQFVPAGKADGVPAIATEVSCHSSGTESPLEMRFPDSVGNARLVATVGQAMDSKSSEEKLEFTMRADGRQADSKNVDFKGTAELSTPMAGVTVVTISAKPVTGSAAYQCHDSATALITNLALVY